MFKFLFGKKDKAPEVKIETQRETVLRAQKELNDILITLSPKARITVCPEDGSFEIDLPEHMPDEALALPAPTPDATPAPASEPAKTDDTADTAPASDHPETSTTTQTAPATDSKPA